MTFGQRHIRGSRAGFQLQSFILSFSVIIILHGLPSVPSARNIAAMDGICRDGLVVVPAVP